MSTGVHSRIIGHNMSEESGMQEFADWLKPVVPEVKVQHVRAGIMYWVPKEDRRLQAPHHQSGLSRLPGRYPRTSAMPSVRNGTYNTHGPIIATIGAATTPTTSDVHATHLGAAPD